jgi:guanylate kinase
MLNNKSKIFIIFGPSGSGKDSVIEGLRGYFEIERIITTTTRPIRPGESQGQPYYFISREQFVADIQAEKFAEYAEQYNGHLYGVSREELGRVEKLGKIGIWKLDYKGVESVKKIYPEIISIFITVSGLNILEKRIRQRDEATEKYVKERMEYTKEGLKHSNIYNFVVYNEEGKLKEAIEKTARIIQENLK